MRFKFTYRNNRTKLYIILGILALSGLITWKTVAPKTTARLPVSDRAAIVYKTPTCGCCGNYVSYLRQHGFNVEVKNMADISEIKTQYGVPSQMQSCHTAVIGGYVVEGHMPIEAIEKLLTERPNIDGIALPGMPSGSPGMPGIKQMPFEINALDSGEMSKFMSF